MKEDKELECCDMKPLNTTWPTDRGAGHLGVEQGKVPYLSLTRLSAQDPEFHYHQKRFKSCSVNSTDSFSLGWELTYTYNNESIQKNTMCVPNN